MPNAETSAKWLRDGASCENSQRRRPDDDIDNPELLGRIPDAHKEPSFEGPWHQTDFEDACTDDEKRQQIQPNDVPNTELLRLRCGMILTRVFCEQCGKFVAWSNPYTSPVLFCSSACGEMWGYEAHH